jgi:ParB-like chromosome segregation protein Spo0J
VLGVLQALHVVPAGESFRLIDGERRWRAAKQVGLEAVPCEVWAGTDQRNAAVAGLVLNEHRKAHGCIAIARRLRQIKNEFDLTQEELARRTGLPLDRIKTYGSLFLGSDGLIEFLEQNDVPLKVALEFVRFERSTNEARVRRVIDRYRESPLTRHQIAALRKRAVAGRADSVSDETRPTRPMFAGRIVRAFERDARRAQTELEDVLRKLGFRIVASPPAPAQASGPGTLP